MTALARIDRIAGRLLRGIPTFCLSALFALLFVNVIARIFKFAGLAWFDEIVQGLFAWMVYTERRRYGGKRIISRWIG